jgi:hypothetical protein
MSGATRRPARTLGALAAAGILLMPSARALADGNEPVPSEWPTVAVPTEGDGGTAQPAPVQWPAVTQPDDAGQSASEPAPTEWPTVEPPPS